MSRRHFMMLAALAALGVAIAGLFALTGRDAEQPEPGELFPGLAERIDDTRSISVITAGNETAVTLERTDSDWVVAELNGYPADWPKVQATLAALATGRKLEAKTNNPQYHDRLGVEDVRDPEASGLELRWSSAEQEFALVVGKAPNRRDGRYVRIPTEDQAWLLDQDLAVSASPLDWVARGIVDIPAARVREAEILRPDRERILALKTSRTDTDFVLAELPEGRTLRSSWSLNRLGSALDALTLEDVQPQSAMDWSATTRLRIQRFDGLEVIAEAIPDDTAVWVRLQAAYHTDNGVDEPIDAIDAARAEVETINQRVSGWAFRLADARSTVFQLSLEDILEPVAGN